MFVAVCFSSAVSVHVLFLITSVLCQVENLILTFICPASFNSPSRGVWQGKSAESSYIYIFLLLFWQKAVAKSIDIFLVEFLCPAKSQFLQNSLE